MDQATIMGGLKKALETGSGDLDALDALLEHARRDIAQAKLEEKRKQEEEAAKKRRGEQVAALANRILNNTSTADDVAIVCNSYFEHEGIAAKAKGTDIVEAVKMSTELSKSIEELATSINDLFSDLKITKHDVDKSYTTKNESAPKPAPKKADLDLDQMIDEALKRLKIR